MIPNSPPNPADPGAYGDSRAGRWKIIGWILGGIALLVLIVLGARYRAATHTVSGMPGPPGMPGAPGAAGAGGAGAGGGGGRGGMNGPLTVGVASVTTGDIPISINALGTVTPLATVTIHPQISGPLIRIAFTEGQMVKRGDLLAQIDPRPYQAAVDQADGQLKRDQASLANAKVDQERYKTLLAQNSISDQVFATQVATVAQDEATIASDRAALEAAQLNLDYCRITSPVAGLVGLRQVDVGNLMQASTTTIAVVTQLQPMSVLFTVPEDSLANILQRLRDGQKLAVDAFDRSMTSKITSGVLSNADNQIDTTTGTLKLRALFDNSKFELFPNQFVNVRLLLDTLHNAIVVPGAAMQQGASGSYLYVVNADSTVSMRAVTTGPSSGDLVSISKGLVPGERVVVDGADQLRDGARVVVPGAAAGAAGAAGAASSGGQHLHRRDASSSGGGYASGSGGYASGGQYRHQRDGASSGGSSGAPSGAPAP
jgi:membrane fusion protein, multidrug efflux system